MPNYDSEILERIHHVIVYQDDKIILQATLNSENDAINFADGFTMIYSLTRNPFVIRVFKAMDGIFKPELSDVLLFDELDSVYTTWSKTYLAPRY